MDILSPPSNQFPDQKAWADDLDIRLLDAQYQKARKLAVRRVVFAAIDRAFNEIPEIETVTFSFSYNKKSIKDSINAYGTGDDPQRNKKINDKFNKLMGSARSRVGQDVQTWESLGVFFGGGQRELVRGSHAYFIEKIFDQETQQWTDDAQAQWQAQWLDISTSPATARRNGPRL